MTKTLQNETGNRRAKIVQKGEKDYFVMCTMNHNSDPVGQAAHGFPFKSFATIGGAERYGEKFLA